MSHQARLAAIVAAPSRLDLGSSRDGCRRTADPEVVALVAGIAAERPLEGVRCVDALLRIGGDDALRVAAGLMASLPFWMQGRREVERRLERQLARAAAVGAGQ
jgi:hypothetical protein